MKNKEMKNFIGKFKRKKLPALILASLCLGFGIGGAATIKVGATNKFDGYYLENFDTFESERRQAPIWGVLGTL